MRFCPFFLFLVLLLITAFSCKTQVKVTDRCGDGFIDPGEECDGSELPAADCAALGYYENGTLRCSSDCTLDVSGCRGGRCGDGVIQSVQGERCEGTNLAGESCETLGLVGGTLACAADCRFDISGCIGQAICGDGIITSPIEQCDGTNLDGETCISLGYYGGALRCGNDCRFDLTPCNSFGTCGDGVIQSIYGEECEGTQLQGETCISQGYYGGTLLCGEDCRHDLTGCAAVGRCGDDVAQVSFGEECDGTDLAGRSCQSEGFYWGTAGCTGTCLLDFSGCSGRCGDGVVQIDEGEVCDGDDPGISRCLDFLLLYGDTDCSTDCQSSSQGTCTDLFRFVTTGTINQGSSVTVDATGHVMITGFVNGPLHGQTHHGNNDIFLMRFDPFGKWQWTRQWGTGASDGSHAVTVDGGGNIYVVGSTLGSLQGTNAGMSDAFVIKADAAGNILWIRQFGTASQDYALAVAVDGSGNVYVAGETYGSFEEYSNPSTASDFFVRKYTGDGMDEWTLQYGTTGGDVARGLVVDASGNLYIAGETSGPLNGQVNRGRDIFLKKVSGTGELLWTRLFGSSSSDYGTGVTLGPDGNILVIGYTFGILDGQSGSGGADAVLLKVTPAGDPVWNLQFGASVSQSSQTYGHSLVTDSFGNIFITGEMEGEIDGQSSQGGIDVFLAKVSSSGTLVWTRMWGTESEDMGLSVARAPAGHLYVTGNMGQGDPVFLKFFHVSGL